MGVSGWSGGDKSFHMEGKAVLKALWEQPGGARGQKDRSQDVEGAGWVIRGRPAGYGEGFIIRELGSHGQEERLLKIPLAGAQRTRAGVRGPE